MKEEHMGDILIESKEIADAAFQEHRIRELSSSDIAKILVQNTAVDNFLKVVGSRVSQEIDEETDYKHPLREEVIIAAHALGRMKSERKYASNIAEFYDVSGFELLAFSEMMKDAPARGNVEAFRDFTDASSFLSRMEARYMDHTTPKIAQKTKPNAFKDAAQRVKEKFRRK